MGNTGENEGIYAFEQVKVDATPIKNAMIRILKDKDFESEDVFLSGRAFGMIKEQILL